MRNIASSVVPKPLIDPKAYAAGTTAGTAVQITPGEEQDSMVAVQVGGIAGSPTSTTVTVTIAGSATSGGSYTTLSTISLVPTSGTQISTSRVIINTASYSFIKATSVVGFTGGTTPSVGVAVALFVRQTVQSDSNFGTVA